MLTPQLIAAALRAAANALDQNPNTGTLSQVQTAATSGQAQSAPAPAPAVGTVTADQLTALIMPHIGNQAIKDALGVAMRANGVANLPEVQPHQYASMYAAFQQVLAQHGVGAAAPAAGGSII